MRSGQATKRAKLKPAQNRGLFDQEAPDQGALFDQGAEGPALGEEPEQGGLFGPEGYRPPKGSIDKLPGALWDKFSKARKPGSPAHTGRLKEQEKKYGIDVRSWFTARRDLWQARVNQELSKLRRILPDPKDQEALALYRDFKNRPGELKQYLAGTHPAYGEVRDLDKAKAAIEQLREPIERAMKPSAAMLAADKVLTKIAEVSLREGQKVGFIDQHVDPNTYVTHLLMRDVEEGEPTFSERFGKALGNKIGRNFPFNQQREFPTILEAAANGWKPRTLNALTAFQTYADKFATARATHLLIQHLQDANIGIWGAKGDRNIPRDWKEIAQHAHPFRNLVGFLDEEGNPRGAYQTLYVPPMIEKALAPITDPDYTSRIAGFRGARLWQAYTKAAQLGLSYFHAMSENYMALAAMGPRGWLKGLKADHFSPEFLEQERDFIGHGGTSSIQNKVYEALGTVNVSSLPSFAEAWRSVAGVRHVDRIASRITEFTFGKLQRQFKVVNYALEKAAWMAQHPNATPAEENSALRDIAKTVNAVYGGLHWENLGVNRASLEMARLVMLAPDWTFSNLFNVKYAFEKGPAGKMSRAFWLRALLGGIAATQLASLMFSGKPSKRPTQVYLGQDPAGKDIYQNLFFKGAPGDLGNLIYNVKDYGPIIGAARTLGNKLAPGLRTGMELMRNENFLGRPLVPKGMNPLAAAVRSSAEFVKGMAPVPWSITNIAEMLFGPDSAKYKIPLEVLTTLFGGTPPTHVKPQEEKQPLSIWDQIRTGKVKEPSVRIPKRTVAPGARPRRSR